MHELSLSTVLSDEDFKRAISILGLMCQMQPVREMHHLVYFQGPTSQIKTTPNLTTLGPLKDLGQPKSMLWGQIFTHFLRQSFVVRGRYPVSFETDFGTGEARDLNGRPAVLSWLDIPEPPQVARPGLTTRKKVEIWDQKNLPRILADNGYTYKTEAIEEAYRFYRDDIEFCLSRYYQMPNNGQQRAPDAPLPAWGSLVLVDAERRWLFTARSHVLQENVPDEIKKGQELMMSLKRELEGIFDFRPYDRRCRDTRVAREIDNTPLPLPSKQVL